MEIVEVWFLFRQLEFGWILQASSSWSYSIPSRFVLDFTVCPAERAVVKGLVKAFLHCLIHPPIDRPGLTFESLQSQQKLQQGNYINKNSTSTLIDSRHHNSSCCKWGARSALAKRRFRAGNVSSWVNPGSTRQSEFCDFFSAFQISHQCHAIAQLSFDFGVVLPLIKLRPLQCHHAVQRPWQSHSGSWGCSGNPSWLTRVETTMPLTPAACIPQFPPSWKSKEPPTMLQESKWKHSQPHAVVLGNFCNRGYWWHCRKRLEQGWGAVNLSHYPLIIFMVQNESCNSLKGKQDLPRGSHVVDKAASK